jgi:hypothetical protein
MLEGLVGGEPSGTAKPTERSASALIRDHAGLVVAAAAVLYVAQ